MHPWRHRITSKALSYFSLVTSGPQVLAFLPAFVLAGFWIGGEILLIAAALIFPIILAVIARLRSAGMLNPGDRSHLTARSEFIIKADRALRTARKKDRKTACFIVELDDFDKVIDQHGQFTAKTVMEQAYDRLASTMRNRDEVFRLSDKQLGICVAPVGNLSLEMALQLATRLKTAMEDPIELGATQIYVSTSIGLCQDIHAASGKGEDLVEAAICALHDAQCNGPSSIRAYSPEMAHMKPCPRKVSSAIDRALKTGEIRPWFQPQISTDTGLITGFEALARWKHPERDFITPAEFLPSIQQAGKMEQLGELMLFESLTALKAWDTSELHVPQIGVNFSPDELRNPHLLKKIEWELDRFDLTPDRLVIEVLETVVATSPDDTIARNINGLSEMGCFIDLDDFGTGHASISSIRRFAIQRLKIDRSFVTKVDQDPEQQRMVSAILLMAERLELDTIAEGVETAGEHAMLSQLGCGHVQGFGIGRPMPFEHSQQWIQTHLSKLSPPPTIGRQTG